MNNRNVLTALLVISSLVFVFPSSAKEANGLAKSIKRLEVAAANGEVAAQFALGAKYVYGINTRHDFEKGKSWLTKAAENGHAPAQMHLGLMYARGRGVGKNPKEAMTWLRKAADQGEVLAGEEYNALKRVEAWEAGGSKGIIIRGNTSIDGECSKQQSESSQIAVGITEPGRTPSVSVYNNCVDEKAARRALGLENR